MVRFENTNDNEYSTKWICKYCLCCILRREAIEPHLKRCVKNVKKPPTEKVPKTPTAAKTPNAIKTPIALKIPVATKTPKAIKTPNSPSRPM